MTKSAKQIGDKYALDPEAASYPFLSFGGLTPFSTFS